LLFAGSLPNSRHRAIALAAQANVFFDATLSRDDLALKLGVNPEEILEVRQAIPDQGNLTLTQVMDLGGWGCSGERTSSGESQPSSSTTRRSIPIRR
jgi:hypothetical protein